MMLSRIRYIAVLLSLVSGTLTVAGQGLPKSAYVVNTLGENLSIIDLASEMTQETSIPLGLYTNHLAISGTRAYVVNSGINDIQVIDLQAQSTIDNFDAGSGTNPYAVEIVSTELAAVSLLFANQVVFISLASGTIVQTVNVGVGPQGMQVSDGFLYVANSGYNGYGWDPGTISAIDLSDYSAETIPVGLNPQTIDKDSEGNLVVCCSGNFDDVGGEITIIEKTTHTSLASVPVGTSITNIAINSGNKAYLATFGFGVLVYDLDNGLFERDINNSLPGGPAVAIDSEDNAYIGDFNADTVYVFDSAHQLINEYLVGDGPIAIALYEGETSDITLVEEGIPMGFHLGRNYPNPFNPTTNFEFRISDRGFVSVNIYNLHGQVVKNIVNRQMSPGSYVASWDGTNDAGRPVASGVYFYRLAVQSAMNQTRKMTLLR